MIYVYPDVNEPIRQGDIFQGLPRVEMLLGPKNLPMIYEPTGAGQRELDWQQSPAPRQPAMFVGSVQSVIGIVITQDCDAVRTDNIAFCEVKRFREVERRIADLDASKKSDKNRLEAFVEIVTQHARVNQKWYYLPPDTIMGFERMAADFQSVFEIPRMMLVQYREWRIGRLNDDVAWPHFRERVAEFFRRYPYNEWYPLTADEVTAYEGSNPVDRYSWQLDKS